MGRLTNFREVLDKVPSNYCALQLLDSNFRGLRRHPPVEEKDRPKINVLREVKISTRNENSKNFVRPHLIYYYAVHQVTLSVNDTPVYYANAHTHARLQHYRTTGTIEICDRYASFIVSQLNWRIDLIDYFQLSF